MSGMPAQTGPKTLQGKAHSSKNAIKHGYSSKKLLIDGENKIQWEQHVIAIAQTFPIVTAAQKIVVEQITYLMWRQQEVNRLIEAQAYAASIVPVTRLTIELSYSLTGYEQLGTPPHFLTNKYELEISDDMLRYSQQEKIIQCIELWEDYQAGEGVTTDSMIDVMPAMVREVFDRHAHNVDLSVDDYLDQGSYVKDLEIITLELKHLLRAAKDALKFNESGAIQWAHYRSVKSQAVLDIYNQNSYQREVVRLERALTRAIDNYQRMSTMHINQLPSTKMAKRTLKNDAITDVDATH